MTERQARTWLAAVLRDIRIAAWVAESIAAGIEPDRTDADARQKEKVFRLQQQLSALQTRRRKAYQDRLDGNIDQAFWLQNETEWREEELKLQSALPSAQEPTLHARRLMLLKF